MTHQLKLAPLVSGHAVKPADCMSVTEVGGGARPKVRLLYDPSSGWHEVSAKWRSPSDGYAYLKALYRHWARTQEQITTAMELDGEMHDVEVIFKTPPEITAVRGGIVDFGCSLLARQISRPTSSDDIIVITEYGVIPPEYQDGAILFSHGTLVDAPMRFDEMQLIFVQ